ncbi:MAG TPA: hypothetical protein VF746_31025 [Longimicrobium sp.]|jgi:hypothetical protein
MRAIAITLAVLMSAGSAAIRRRSSAPLRGLDHPLRTGHHACLGIFSITVLLADQFQVRGSRAHAAPLVREVPAHPGGAARRRTGSAARRNG